MLQWCSAAVKRKKPGIIEEWKKKKVTGSGLWNEIKEEEEELKSKMQSLKLSPFQRLYS